MGENVNILNPDDDETGWVGPPKKMEAIIGDVDMFDEVRARLKVYASGLPEIEHFHLRNGEMRSDPKGEWVRSETVERLQSYQIAEAERLEYAALLEAVKFNGDRQKFSAALKTVAAVDEQMKEPGTAYAAGRLAGIREESDRRESCQKLSYTRQATFTGWREPIRRFLAWVLFKMGG
jgi:hypothetical protein